MYGKVTMKIHLKKFVRKLKQRKGLGRRDEKGK
jgi:hypothetical protein